MESTRPALKRFTESHFNMWRCVIVMAHADGVIHEAERDFFEKVFASLSKVYAVPPAYLETFRAELADEQDIDVLLPKVTAPEFRSLLIYFSQIVAWIDGSLSPDESELLKKLYAAYGKDADASAKIRQEIAERMFRRKTDLEERHIQRNPLFYALDALLSRLGLDPLD